MRSGGRKPRERTCRRSESTRRLGTLLWQTVVGQTATSTGGTLELAGNGSGVIAAEVLTDATAALVALNGTTGATLWKSISAKRRTCHRCGPFEVRPGSGTAVGYGVRSPDDVKETVVSQSPHRQPRRDRGSRHAHLPRARHRAPSPSTPISTATRCTSATPTRPTPSAGRPRPRATSTPTRSSTRSSRAAPRRSTPGYGFFAENADFARAIIVARRRVDRPAARGHRDHGRQDLVAEGRRGRRRRSRCPARSTPSPMPSEVVAFGNEFGWPVAIKAAYGGGGKGLKVAASADEAAGGVRSADARGAGLLRSRRVLPRALPHPPAPHRDPGLRRHPRQRRVARRARLLDAAPAPEAHRGERPRPRSTTRSAPRWARPR